VWYLVKYKIHLHSLVLQLSTETVRLTLCHRPALQSSQFSVSDMKTDANFRKSRIKVC